MKKTYFLLLTALLPGIIYAAPRPKKIDTRKVIPMPATMDGWETRRYHNAQGEMISLGNGVFKITKTNADGILEFRMKDPITLDGAGRWFIRSEYQSVNNSGNTLFFFRLAQGKDLPANMITSGAPTHKTETYLVNTTAGEWKERIYSVIAGNKPRQYYPTILVIGNPAEITVRGMHIDPKEKIRKVPEINARPPYYTRKETDAILAQRPDATCKVSKDANGDIQLLLNGKPVAPVMYKHEGLERFERMFRFEDFAAAGISFLMATVPVCHNLKTNEVVLGKGKYDFAKIDRYFYNLLRRNPQAHILVRFSFYEPYIGWAQENWNELWQNENGLRALGNNCHLKFFSNTPEKEKYPYRVAYWPSYSSQKWREDYKQIIADVMQYIMKQPYGKAIVGATFGGGDDGQFQYRKDDYSPIAMKAFHDFLRREYKTLENMNKSWKTSYNSFEEVKIPKLEAIAPGELPFQNPSVAIDYRKFQEQTGWELREYFSSAIKQSVNKDIITLVYGIPDAFPSFGIADAPSLDVIVQPGAYPLRANGYAYPMQPDLTYQLYGKLWLNEQDLRSWRAQVNSEITERIMNTNMNIADWTSTHRKVLGPSFAARLGWWYFSLPYQGGRFFDDPGIMSEIKKCLNLYMAMRNLPYRKLRPDVCVVADVSSNYAISAYPYAAAANPNAARSSALSAQLEKSGVPYDIVYLRDILKFPELQQYKIYIFRHNVIISSTERAQIDKLLKKDGKTLIWIHSSGYLDEKSKSTDNMKSLTGFAVSTDEKFARQASYTIASHQLNNGLREVNGFSDMSTCLQMPFGLKNIWGSPTQIFYLTDLKPGEAVCEDNDGNPTGAYRQFKNWNSLIITVPNGLSPQLLNSIAAKTGAYRAGKSGHHINMNGNFFSIHPLADGKYTFHTPPGVTEVFDPDTGKSAGKAPQVTLNLTCGKTVWLFMK